MSAVAQPVAGLDRYLTALEQLAHAHRRFGTGEPWIEVLDESAPLEVLDDLVATLCRHARVAADLVLAAESLCAALVAERYHLQR